MVKIVSPFDTALYFFPVHFQQGRDQHRYRRRYEKPNNRFDKWKPHQHLTNGSPKANSLKQGQEERVLRYETLVTQSRVTISQRACRSSHYRSGENMPYRRQGPTPTSQTTRRTGLLYDRSDPTDGSYLYHVYASCSRTQYSKLIDETIYVLV